MITKLSKALAHSHSTHSISSRLYKIAVCIYAVLLISSIKVQAQHIEVGGGVGAMLYKGDILTNIDPRYSKLGGQLFLRHTPGKAVSFKYAVLAGSIYGSDEKRKNDPLAQARNRTFNSSIQELSVTMEYNFLDYRSNIKRMPLSPYLFGGLALFHFDPAENKKPTYSLSGISIPFGVGLKYVLYKNWNLNVEFGARKTFTDYLDNLSGTDITNPTQNGNPKNKDMYLYTGISISYTFYKIQCPEFY
ncbi:DUF6089 family protein [Xanthocytophaga agilis]|uniref:DUF6089 family protein n=1 Tax=Xanthocytophaga agilis TaxID=3048010 RepID=A0AAE3R642_9BACT|nr:DUF6089 family protein [Xanthocytophaga agilis]MDJ1504449.1 DUF6089 family protein [Xanthocytophaga agilis]